MTIEYQELPLTPEVKFAQDIAVAIAHDHGHISYIVGGYYRDFLLGLRPKDLDMVTCVLPDVLEGTKVPNAHTVPTGKEHGTITFVQETTGISIEVTTTQTRKENSDDRKGSEVVFLDGDDPDLWDFPRDPFFLDAHRRDLSINALLYEPVCGMVRDYVDGFKDLEDKVLRFVGDPVDACRGDALRVLRYVRFYAKLAPMGFTIDPRIFDMTEDSVVLRRLSKLSAERVRDEFLKILSMPDSHNVAYAITLLEELNVLDLWFPELTAMIGVEQNIWHSEDVWGHSLLAVENSKPRLTHRLFALFHDVGKPICSEFKSEDYGYSFHGHESVSADMFMDMCNRMKLGYKKSGDFDLDIEQVTHLIRHHMDAFVDGKPSRILKRLGVDKWGDGMVDLSWDVGRSDFFAKSPEKVTSDKNQMGNERLLRMRQRVADIIASQHAKKVKDLSVNGHDVMSFLKLKPGPRVGQILQALFELVVDEDVPDTPQDLILELSKIHSYY